MATYQWQIDGFVIDATQTQSESSLSVTETGLCVPFGGVPTMMYDLFGGYRRFGRRIIRVWPQRHWLFPWCRASKFNCKEHQSMQYVRAQVNNKRGLSTPWEPRDPVTGAQGKARCTITYTMPTIDESTIEANDGEDSDQEMDIATESWDFGGKNLALKGQYFKWKYSNQPIAPDDASITKSFPELHIQLVRHRCLNPPADTICKLFGKINKSPFRIVTAYFPPGTVRFEGATAGRKLTTGQGFKFYEIGYKFAIMPTYELCAQSASAASMGWVGWNRVWNARKGWWEEYEYTAGVDRGVHLYDEDAVSTVTSPNGRISMKGMQLLFWPGAR